MLKRDVFVLLQSYTNFPVIEFNSPRPDPAPPTARSADIGTLRLFFEIDGSKKTVVQDYTDQTILSGLASLGGLWTTANVVMTVLFGGSLLFFALG